jgi:hypothetical protein
VKYKKRKPESFDYAMGNFLLFSGPKYFYDSQCIKQQLFATKSASNYTHLVKAVSNG